MAVKNRKVVIKTSLKKGKGMFSTQYISKGEIVLETIGKKVSTREVDFIKPASLIANCFQIEKGYFLCPFSEESLNGIFLVNHSCNPNCGTHKKMGLIAMRDIYVGEEITYDYACSDAEYPGIEGKPFAEMKCQCESINCRKLITGKDWERKDLQEKYKGYFSDFIQEMIDDHQS